MDGYELARRMRATLDGRARPFMVAVTGTGCPRTAAARSPRDSTST
jgi:CheY-like chemotaxis protein